MKNTQVLQTFLILKVDFNLIGKVHAARERLLQVLQTNVVLGGTWAEYGCVETGVLVGGLDTD